MWGLMDTTLLFKTKRGNAYLFSANNNKFFLIHPILNYLLRLKKNGIELNKYIKKMTSNIYIDGYGNCSKKEIRYYYNKILFFESKKVFKNINIIEAKSRKLIAKDILNSMANTNICTFEVTERCNLNCKYCTYGHIYHDYDKRENRDINISNAKKFIIYLIKLWNSSLNRSHNKNISLGFYGGEPLLNMFFIKDIVKFVSKLNTLHHQFTFHMTTNGVWLHKYMGFLIKHNFKLLISLDGNEKHNQYRVFSDGKSSHHVIFNNILKLRNRFPDYFDKNVEFNAVLHNKNSVLEIIDYFKRNFDKIPKISELSPIGILPSERKNFLKIYKNTVDSKKNIANYKLIEKDTITGDFEDIVHLLHKYSGYVFKSYHELMDYFPIKKSIPTGTCIPFSRKIFVTASGKILPCERIGHQFAMGNINDKEIELDFDQIAKKFNVYLKKMRETCKKCYRSLLCDYCIFHLNINDKHVKCSGYANVRSFSKYLSGHFNYLEDDPSAYEKIMKEIIKL